MRKDKLNEQGNTALNYDYQSGYDDLVSDLSIEDIYKEWGNQGGTLEELDKCFTDKIMELYNKRKANEQIQNKPQDI